METAAAVRRGLEGTALDKDLPFLGFNTGSEDQGAILRFMGRGLPVGHAADRVADIAGDAGKGHGREPLQPRPLDLSGHYPGRGMAPLALAGDIVPDRFKSLVQLTLVDRVLEGEVMNRTGPFPVLFFMAAATDIWGGEIDGRLVPLEQ